MIYDTDKQAAILYLNLFTVHCAVSGLFGILSHVRHLQVTLLIPFSIPQPALAKAYFGTQ